MLFTKATFEEQATIKKQQKKERNARSTCKEHSTNHTKGFAGNRLVYCLTI